MLLERRSLTPLGAGALIAFAHATITPAQLQPHDVLLLWNSRSEESTLIRNAYIAAHPGVHEFDLDNDTLVGQPPSFPYNQFDALIRKPLADHLRKNFVIDDPFLGVGLVGGPVAIATTRGLPALITGEFEFHTYSTFASVESELTGVLYDLRPNDPLQINLDAGPIANPLFRYQGSILELPRVVRPSTVAVSGSGLKTQYTIFTDLPGSIPGIYTVSRLDAAPQEGLTAAETVVELIKRSQTLEVLPCTVRNLFDEWPVNAPRELDDESFGSSFYPSTEDFDNAVARLEQVGFPAYTVIAQGNNTTEIGDPETASTFHDQTVNFVTAQEIPGPQRELFILGSYGENHDIVSPGENPPGRGTYLREYDIHPAGIFIAYESFNGNTLHSKSGRQDQQQALEWIQGGGSFTIPHVKEPFTPTVAKLTQIVRVMLEEQRSWGEASIISMPALSWVNAPIGDPLATIAFGNTDRNRDGRFDSEDLYIQLQQPQEQNCDGILDIADAWRVEERIRQNEKQLISTER